MCETFARESGLNYVRGDNSEGGRLGDADHVDRKLIASQSSSRPATKGEHMGQVYQLC